MFTTLARDPRKFFAAGLLDPGHLTLRQRELAIGRITALCRSEYEWGVHITLFGRRARFDEAQTASLVSGSAADSCWGEDDRLLLRLCDELHAHCTVSDELWGPLHAAFADEALLELLMLAGFYTTVSYLTNALRLPLEPASTRFPSSIRERGSEVAGAGGHGHR